MPADVTQHACGAMLAAPLIANGAAVHHSEVQGLGAGVAKGWVGVGGGEYLHSQILKQGLCLLLFTL